MRKTIKNVSLIELVPPNLQSDPDVIAIGRATDKQWQTFAGKLSEVLTYADIEGAASEVLNMLAVEMNVDFYDEALPLSKCRALVKNGYTYKYRKGTVRAVRQVVTDAYDQAHVEEWSDYGGEPYHFRITTEAAMPDEDTINKMFKAVSAVQNIRSKLDYLGALKDVGLTGYWGFVMHQSQYHKIIQQS